MTMNVRVTNPRTTDMIEITTTSSTSVIAVLRRRARCGAARGGSRDVHHESVSRRRSRSAGLRVTFALPVLAPLVAVIFHVP